MMVNRFTIVKWRRDGSFRGDRRSQSVEPIIPVGAPARPLRRCAHRGHTAKEPVMKIASYGTMHFGVAFGVAWALTGSVKLAGAIAPVEPAVRAVLVPPLAAMAAAEGR
jgi:hypothetical protein